MKNTQTLQLLNRQSLSSRLVFIDPTVEDYQSLVAGVLPDTEVFILNTQRDGVEQISELLATKFEITSLHIVSHGAPGQMYLGNAQLGQHTLNHYAGQLINWAKALSTDAQILLYGCDVAQTQLGRAFVQQLSELTGAVVFASDDKTGSAAKGGNWKLEVTTATSTATLAFKPTTLEAYGAVLAQPYLVKDISPGSGSSIPQSSYFNELSSYVVNVDGIAYFIANDGSGDELWKSDGTEAGTVLVKNIYPFSNPDSAPYYAPYGLINFEGVLYFFTPVSSGEEGYIDNIYLWKSDGTNAGTVPIDYISSADNPPVPLTKTDSNFYFSIPNPFHHDDLWKSDGTEAGTFLLKELYPDIKYYAITSSVSVNDTLYFSVDFDEYKYELWKSDGTTAGTVLIAGFYSTAFYNLTNINGTLYFFVDNENSEGYNSELWKSDGTETGTVVVKSFSIENYNYATNVANVNGTLYFSAYDDAHGEELWKSDGTTAGTVLVKDIKPGSGSSLYDTSYSLPSDYSFPLIEVNGILYFTADDGTNGIELWKSDGTESGTVLIKDINSGSASSLPSNFRNVNGILYFTANDGIHGDELWKSDGTTAGTALVKDINFGTNSSSISELTNVGDILYFNADDGINGRELWALNTNPAIVNPIVSITATDANAAEANNKPGIFRISRTGDVSTALTVKYTIIGTATNGIDYNQLNNTVAIAPGQSFVDITVTPVDDILKEGNETVTLTLSTQPDYDVDTSDSAATVVIADDPTTAVVPQPYLVKDIFPGYTGSTDFYSNYAADFNGILYFFAEDGVHGRELWKSDGTETGTVLVKDIEPGSSGSSSYDLTKVNNTLYFYSDSYISGISGLWKSDGTETGTVLVKDIYISNSDSNLTDFKGTLFFVAPSVSNSDESLWKSDGTAAGTVLVKDIPTSSSNFELTAVNDTLYFTAGGLWKSNGTTAGTTKIKNIGASDLTNVNGTLYFVGDDGTHGKELWKSNGTAASTVLVKDINLHDFDDTYRRYPTNLTSVNNTLYFRAYDPTHGFELWKSNGTTAGTVLVKDINPGVVTTASGETFPNSSSPQSLTNANGILYFIADDGTHGYELWKSDGTTAGTVLVKDINPGSSSSFVTNDYYELSLITNVNGKVYFVANDGIHGRELWKSDGTTAGTVLVKDINLGSDSSDPSDLINVDGTLYFTANDGIQGRELWALDTNDFNVINGNGSHDPLIGTAGSDRIVGGTGSKTITGGAGNDEFVYTSIKEVGQRITDFIVGEDKIVLTQLLDSLVTGGYNGSNAIADGYVRLVQGKTANSTILQIDRDGTLGNAVFRNFIELDNITPQQMNNTNNFVF
ncbi:DUF4347 domain-containing protein [Nostocaceae cyanobacterium CENA369]|uniref:DUF4347 domain-containing protein n=1 Tax=Dendronalium phyllosphericum CENA369 TaxID=1725256 RepID=A0A8J7II08_9NOST|nr:ELWxxDGT repeat protein [Dendronalium phyllosphericum]MBH8578183.1 DUF4347 domain-containing protein [Dendronalium phyllosphericum CENA369]